MGREGPDPRNELKLACCPGQSNFSESAAIPAEAKAINDFGNHFLTDAFAAGHLLAKHYLMEQSRKSFEALPTPTGGSSTKASSPIGSRSS